MLLNDDQYLDRLRQRQPVTRVSAYLMLVGGAVLATGIGVWGLSQRIRLTSAFDEVAAMVSPTTRDTIDSLQYSRDISTFALGATIGMLLRNIHARLMHTTTVLEACRQLCGPLKPRGRHESQTLRQSGEGKLICQA